MGSPLGKSGMKMRNNICIVEKAALRKGLASGWYGPMVVTPQALYFISLTEVDMGKEIAVAPIVGGPIGALIAYNKNKQAMSETEDKVKSLENYAKQLDDLVLEKENSLKINKIDIELCKVPKRYYLQTGSPKYGAINIRTKDKQKYEILFWEPKKIIPELKDYLITNLYPAK